MTTPQSFDTLSTHAVRLNELTDRANQLIRDAEARLSEMSVGIYREAKFRIRPDHPKLAHLLYQKHNGKFIIGVLKMSLVAGEVVFTPWAECTREEKIAAVSALPDLIKNIEAEAKKLADRAEEILASFK